MRFLNNEAQILGVKKDTRIIPRIRILVQELDASGKNSLRGEHFSIIATSFEEVVNIVRDALMEKYATCIGKSGKVVFIPYEPTINGGKEARCPYCNAIIGFDPHDRECPLYKILVMRWISQRDI